jgi:DNA polymerase-3 subunit gamma/tau
MALQTKYRPKFFAEVRGQNFTVETLQKSLKAGKFAQVYLFAGHHGCGKTTIARLLAKALNCQQQNNHPSAEPCGTCPSCKAIEKDNSLDYVEFDAASNSGIEHVRELIQNVSLCAAQSRYRVFVVDECHQLSRAAQDVLLKTLEEPPAHVVFIFTTTDPQRLNDTVRSRCHEFRFRSPTHEESGDLLREVAEKEGIDITDPAIAELVAISKGSVRDAQKNLDLLASRGERITPDLVREFGGVLGFRQILPTIQAIQSANSIGVVNNLDPLFAQYPCEEILRKVSEIFRDIFVLAATGDESLLENPVSSLVCDRGEAAKKLQRLKEASTQLHRVSERQKQIWLEVVLMELCKLSSSSSSSPPQPEPKRETPKEDNHDQVLQKLKPRLRRTLQPQLVKIEGDTCWVRSRSPLKLVEPELKKLGYQIKEVTS